MKAADLYSRLEEDFKLSECTDEWDIEDNGYITRSFISRGMGLMTDSTDTVERSYTAVFPSSAVINKILSYKAGSGLLFVHHPMDWDIKRPVPFGNIPQHLLKKLKDSKISIYNLHTALDKNGEYSTTVNLARALEIEAEEDFYEYSGGHVGVIGKTKCNSVRELKEKLEEVYGHNAVLYGYADEDIFQNRVALIAGGGNEEEVYAMLKSKGINAYVTGITSARTGYEPLVRAHESARENKVSILGGTHYSTEKFACIKMTEYFERFGLPCKFIPELPCMQDM